ncbi:glycosyltransferase family 4 protein [Candidatus Woesearchaeota archaeon]|nr:glycosyltransferase family 4 protein [Candidatus Woesearchaeota archaeon]
MKTCLITSSYPYRGNARGVFIKTLEDNLKFLGVKIILVKPDEKYSDIINPDGIALSLKRNPTAWFQLIPCIFRLYIKAIKEGKKCDIIHGNWIISTIPCLILKKFYKKPTIVTIRGGDIYFVKGKGIFFYIFKYLLNSVDIVVCVGDRLYEELKKYRKDVEFITNGVPLNDFIPRNKIKMRNKLGLPIKSKLILYSGRLVEEKGVINLLNAFVEISKSIKDLKLVVNGEGDLISQIKRVISTNNLDDRFIYIPRLEHKKISYLMNACDVFVFPRIKEAGSNLLLEAASCGMPIIATDEGYIGEIIKKDNILLIDKDVKSLKNALLRVIQDKNLQKELSIKSRKNILEYSCSWRDNAQKYVKLYNKLLVLKDPMKVKSVIK